jgi:hypothetical protein
MKRLLKLYYYRSIHEKSVLIFLLIIGFLGLLIGINVGNNYAQNIRAGMSSGDIPGIADLTLVGFSTGLSFNLSVFSGNYLSSNFYVVAAVSNYLQIGLWSLIVITLFIGREWRERTFRNQILAGESRIAIYLSSLVVSATIGLINLIAFIGLFMIGASLFGVPFFLPSESSLVGAWWVAFFLCLLIFLTFITGAVCFSYLIPNSWGALGVFVGGSAFISLFTLAIDAACFNTGTVCYLFENFLTPYQYSRLSTLTYDSAISSYTTIVNQYSGNTTYHPVISAGHSTSFILTTVFSNLFYMAAATFFGALSFVKRDLK